MDTNTTFGFFGGLLFSLCFGVVAVKTLPGPVDLRLFIAILMVFPMWLTTMMYGYSASVNRQLVLRVSAVCAGLVGVLIVVY